MLDRCTCRKDDSNWMDCPVHKIHCEDTTMLEPTAEEDEAFQEGVCVGRIKDITAN